MTQPSEEKHFSGTIDFYGGITVSTDSCMTDLEFETRLADSLKKWTQDGVRSVWFNISLTDSRFIPILAEQGFKFHHAKSSEVLIMLKWLATSEPCSVPQYAHHMVGVGGFVVNEKEEILVIEERFKIAKSPHWKLPGGYVEAGENLYDAAVREVFEETGIRSEFDFLIAFRHMHQANFGCSDLYFILCLKPLTTEIDLNSTEIAKCQWMPIREYASHPHVHEVNRYFVEKYFEAKENSSRIGKKDIQLSLPGLKRLQEIYAIDFGTEDFKNCFKMN